MVNACIERDANGNHRVMCKRAKYKHWHELGRHRETDVAFYRGLQARTIQWKPEIIERDKLF